MATAKRATKKLQNKQTKIADEHDHARKSKYPEFESSLLLLAR